MNLKGLLSLLVSVSLLINPAFAQTSQKSFRVPAENQYGVKLVKQMFGDVKNIDEFVKVQSSSLSPRDKAYLLKASKGLAWPKITTHKDEYFKIGEDYKVRFLGLYSKAIEINGIKFKLDFSAPLDIQAEVIARKLHAKNKNAVFNLVLPEAHAFLPILGLVAGVAIRVVASVAGVVGRAVGPSLLGSLSGALVTSIVVFDKDPFGLIICKVTGDTRQCETEDGTEVSPNIIDSPGTEYNLQVEINKCPDTADGTFQMKMRVPEQRMSTSYTVSTEQVDGVPRIKTISEIHQSDAQSALPPVQYNFDTEGLKDVKWVGSVVTTDGSSHQVHKALDRRFSEEGSADNTAENRDRWESFRQKASFVRQALSLYCNIDNKRSVSEPGQTQPQTEVIVPPGSSSTPTSQ